MPPPSLQIGQTLAGKPFSLPLELVTQTVAILAKRGVGKTYTASVIAEEILTARQPICVIDPTGAWWGLKASADGEKVGFPVVVFGGDHPDLPLEVGAGEIIATALVEKRFSAVLDLSLFRKGEASRFIGEFLMALYRLNREAMHVIIDEADAFAPQRPFGDEARTLGAMEDLVRRGRKRGIGCTLITQRPAVINKNVLTQCEVLVALRLVHPRDIDAIEEWINVHADEDQAQSLITSLPSLPVGEAWFWSPGWGQFLERVRVRRRRTFDSGATPAPGVTLAMPKRLAPIDVTALGESIAATAARARAEDPQLLMGRIADLEAELAAAGRRTRGDDQVKASIAAALAKMAHILPELGAIQADLSRAGDLLPNSQGSDLRSSPRASMPAPTPANPLPSPSGPRSAPSRTLARAERLILTALAQFGACSKAKAAAISGYAMAGGGFNNALSALRTKGAIERGEPLKITTEGRELLGDFDRLPIGAELVEYWKRRLPKAERTILEVLASRYPAGVEKDALGRMCGYEPAGGGFNNALSALRTLELITRGREIAASAHLF